MTPKEKALELTNKFELIDRKERWEDAINLFEAKKIALICVDEILSLGFVFYGNPNSENNPEYWNEVIKELNEL